MVLGLANIWYRALLPMVHLQRRVYALPVKCLASAKPRTELLIALTGILMEY